VDPISSRQAVPQAAEAMTEFWTLALLPASLWWSTWCKLLGPCHPPVPHDDAAEEEGQLVVPEPIEADGEHALFA